MWDDDQPPKRQRMCHYYDRSLSKVEHLGRHVRSHTKERPFVCTLCAKSYERQDGLQRHMKSYDHAQNCYPTSFAHPNSTGSQGEEYDAALTVSTIAEENTAHTMETSSLLPEINPGARAWNESRGFRYDTAVIAADLSNISPSNPGLLSSSVPPLEPLWRRRENFDDAALDSSIGTAIFDWWCPAGSVPGILQPAVFDKAPRLGGDDDFEDTQSATSAVVGVQRN